MSATVSATLRAFYVENRQQLYTYAVSITHQREAAEDAIHQAFQQLLRRGRLPDELRPYLFRCVRNAALDHLRRAGPGRDTPFDEAGSWVAAAPAAGLSAAELQAGLQLLSPDEREAIILKIYDDCTFQEIADLRGVPLPTAASWYRRGLDKLRASLTRENP